MRSALSALSAALLTCCAAYPPFSAAPAADLQPPFNIAPPYLGADVATSIALSADRALWLHGDTLVGAFAHGARSFRSMPRNSVALRYANGTIRHAIRAADRSNPAHVGFFTPPDAAQWYWPTCLALLAGQLSVFAMRIEPGPPGLFPFQLAGTDVLALGAAAALPDDPLAWPAPAITPLPFTSANQTLGNAVGQSADFLYLLGGCGAGAREAFMARLPAAAAAAGEWRALQQWGLGGAWEPMAGAGAPAPLFDFVPSEATLTFHEALGAWVILTVNTFLGPTITAHLAPAPEGPWAAADVYRIPDEQLAGGAFCYAGKVHVELAAAGAREIVFSYMCNTPTISELLNRTDVYIPQLVRVTY